MLWWSWMIIGTLLLCAEMFIGADFFLVFIGVAAMLSGILKLMMPSVPMWAEWLTFASLALVTMIFFRARVYRRLLPRAPDMGDDVLGVEVQVPDRLEPEATCRIVLQGSTWTARNVGSKAIAPGTRVRVVGVDGITLHVHIS